MQIDLLSMAQLGLSNHLEYNALVEDVARDLYCDSYTQYGTCSPNHWKETSEIQREYFRGMARQVLKTLVQKGFKRQRINTYV